MTLMDPLTDWVDGKVGSGALDFDGSNDYVDAGNDSSLITADNTSCAWVDITGDGGATYLNIVGINNQGYELNYVPSTDKFDYWVQTSAGWGNSPAVSIGTYTASNSWIHVCGVYDGAIHKLYVNGVAQTDGDRTGDISYNPSPYLWIGDDNSNTPFTGQIDEVRVYNRALSAEEINRLYKATSGTKISKPNLSTGLVGYWNFDVHAGGTNVVDLSGFGNDGAMTLMDPLTDWVDGKVGSGALDFDGSDDYVDMGSQPNLRFNNGNFTIAGWVKPDVITGTNTLTANYVDTNKGYFFGIYNSKLGYYSNAWKSANTTLSTGIWYHIAIIIDSSGNYIMYLNGVSDGSGASTLPATGEETFKIGAYGLNGGLGRFNGQIDEVRVYNRALSAEEIELLYNLGSLK